MPLPSGSERIRAQLFALQDAEYKAFQSALMPTVPVEKVIGVRVPALRRLAAQLSGTPQAEAFLRALPHAYYEENNLHGFLLERIRDYPSALAGVEAFLPWVDNWATCDGTSPRVFGAHRQELLTPLRRWLDSGRTYTVRYAVGMLQRWYLDDAFRPEYPAWVAGARGAQEADYYVDMMRAWYFATALAKQPEEVWPWLEEKRLDPWTHNRAVQKALESRRISPADKQRLRTLRIRS